MRHTDQRHMSDEMLEGPDELIVESRNRRRALYISEEGDAVFYEGDLQDDRIKRFAEQMKTTQNLKPRRRK